MLQTLKKYKYDLLICAAIIIISIIEKFHINYTLYSNGLQNTRSLKFLLLVFIYEALKVVVVFFAIVRIFFVLKYIQKLKRYIITAILSILIFIGSWILPFTIDQAGAVYFLRGYEKWVKKNVEIDKIQEWLISGQADKYMNKSYFDGFPDDLPDFMTSFKYISITFHDPNSETEKYVKFDCGTGLNYTGIVVGLPTMKTQTDEVIIESESYYEYRRLIKPGVYIYDGG